MMKTEKIEAFWQDATADDVARVMAGETVEARFRDSAIHLWMERLKLAGVISGLDGKPRWIASTGSWVFCQVYREPSWHANKPDPGPGWVLLGKFPDEPKLGTDEYWSGEGWMPVGSRDNDQLEQVWYRRRIEQLLSGHRWLANGDRLESGDLYYEKGALLEVGHEYWGNRVMLTEAFMRKIEQPKSEPVEPEPRQILTDWECREGDTYRHPNGMQLKVTEKGFEVTQ